MLPGAHNAEQDEPIRVLIGHRDDKLPRYDTSRFEVRVVTGSEIKSAQALTIEGMLKRCTPGWIPDVYLHSSVTHAPIPPDIDRFEGLAVTEIHDWERTGQTIWAAVGEFDLALCERSAIRVLSSIGYTNGRFHRLYGCDPEVHRVLGGVERDIDVMFIGSLHANIWKERSIWLDRLAALSSRFKVLIATGAQGEDYVRLLNRARIVFNRSVRGETNMRAYEAAACGALVLNETENLETREIFADGVDCVYYSEDNLEQLIEHYLTRKAERQAIANSGRRKAAEEHSFAAHFQLLLDDLKANKAHRYRPMAALSTPDRKFRWARQMYLTFNFTAFPVAARLLTEARDSGLSETRASEGRAAIIGRIAEPNSGEIGNELLDRAFGEIRYGQDESDPCSAVTMAGLLLLSAKSEFATAEDASRAAVLLEAAARHFEAQAKLEEIPNSDELLGFAFPRPLDNYNGWLSRAFLRKLIVGVTKNAGPEAAILAGGLSDEPNVASSLTSNVPPDREAVPDDRWEDICFSNEQEWARAMVSALAWRCRSTLSDLYTMAGQHEIARQQARLAAEQAPEEAEALLRLGRCELRCGAFERAETCYRRGLEITPLAHSAWVEYAAVLAALGSADEAHDFIDGRLQRLQAIPAWIGLKQGLQAVRNGLPPKA